MPQLLDRKDLEARGISYSSQHLWRLTKAGQFPRPVKMSARRNVWLADEIDAYLQARIEARDQPQGA